MLCVDRVGVALDSWMFPIEEEIYYNVEQPLLFINSEDFQWKENVLKILKFDTGNEDRKMVTIRYIYITCLLLLLNDFVLLSTNFDLHISTKF